MENIRPISLDMLLGATSKTGPSRSAGRSQTGGPSEADGQPKEFVLPEDDAPTTEVAAPKAAPGHSRTDRPDARAQSGDRPRSRDPHDSGRDDQAVNPLAAASQPEPAQALVVAQDTANPSDAMKVAGAAQQQAGPAAKGVTGIAAWWQFAQGANQPATGQGQAMGSPAGAVAPSWLQAQGNAQASADGPQQAAGQAQATTAPVANTTAGQTAGTHLGPHAPRMSTPAEAAATAPAAATAATAVTTAAGQTVPGVATEVAPAGPEAKTTLPNALPKAVAGEEAQMAPPNQANQANQPNQARGHRATTHSLAGIVQQSMASAVGEKAPAEMDPNLQAQAKLIDRAELASKFRSASLPEQAEAVEERAAAATNILGGSHQVDGAAQAPAQAATDHGQQRVAEASRPADQIIESVRHAIANGQREVTINLNPPELGRVRLTMYSEGNEIRGRLDVDNPRTLTEIRHQADLLTQRLAEDGIAIRRLEVHQMSNTGGQAGSFSPQHQDSAAQTPWSHARPTPGEQQRGRESADLAAAAARRAPTGAGESSSTSGLNVWM